MFFEVQPCLVKNKEITVELWEAEVYRENTGPTFRLHSCISVLPYTPWVAQLSQFMTLSFMFFPYKVGIKMLPLIPVRTAVNIFENLQTHTHTYKLYTY